MAKESSRDDVAVLEGILKKLRRLAKGGKVVVVAEKEDEDAKAALEILMNFDLQWLIKIKTPNQLIDPNLSVL